MERVHSSIASPPAMLDDTSRPVKQREPVGALLRRYRHLRPVARTAEEVAPSDPIRFWPLQCSGILPFCIIILGHHTAYAEAKDALFWAGEGRRGSIVLIFWKTLFTRVGSRSRESSGML